MSEEGSEYVRSRSTTARLLEKFPQLGFVRRGGIDYAVALIMVGFDEGEIDGSTVLETDRRVDISSMAPLDRSAFLSIAPSVSDKLIIYGASYDIIKVSPPRSAPSTVIFWELQVRHAGNPSTP